MTNIPHDHSTTNLPPSISALVAWLHEHQLSQPAWVLLELAHPFGWLFGQMGLLAQPLAHGTRWEEAFHDLLDCLQDTEQLAELRQTLTPKE